MSHLLCSLACSMCFVFLFVFNKHLQDSVIRHASFFSFKIENSVYPKLVQGSIHYIECKNTLAILCFI